MKISATEMLCCGLLFLLPCFFASSARAADEPKTSEEKNPWKLPGALFRASYEVVTPPTGPEFGFLIEVPEFGASRRDGGDLALFGPEGNRVPLRVVKTLRNNRILALAEGLEPGAKYELYFGGNAVFQSVSWNPLTSLLLETRSIPPASKAETLLQMQSLWSSASDSDGAGFVQQIAAGLNPFGQSRDFASHFSGFFKPPSKEPVFLYTLSSDASFVLINHSPAFSWPGVHPARATRDELKGKSISATGTWIRVDYFHVKSGEGPPTMVLGWKNGETYEPIPASAWAHPGTTKRTSLEQHEGLPVPFPDVTTPSYLGFNGTFFHLLRLRAPTLPESWTAEWSFGDGAKVVGTNAAHIHVGEAPAVVTLTLRGENRTLKGTRTLRFPNSIPAASINDASQRNEYLEALGGIDFSEWNGDSLAAALSLLLPFAKDEQILPFANRLLSLSDQRIEEDLLLECRLIWLRSLALSRPAEALLWIRENLSTQHAPASPTLVELEAELLVYFPQGPDAPSRIRELGELDGKKTLARLMKIRLGDWHRLNGSMENAVQEYQRATEANPTNYLPVQDQAASMEIRSLLDGGHREEALARLRKWELANPMAKLDRDFLLLSARNFAQFGRWHQAMRELDSFQKLRADDPLLVESQYYQARFLAASGQTEKSRAAYEQFVKTYPAHPLTQQAKSALQSLPNP